MRRAPPCATLAGGAVTVYFFGCWKEPGHYLFDRHGNTISDPKARELRIPFRARDLDGLFAPPFGNENETATALSHVHHWTILGIWDRSVDRRPGSNAAFLVSGIEDEDAAWRHAREAFPQVVARLKAAKHRGLA